MIQVDFSCEEIEFTYKEKAHLSTKLTIRNKSQTIIYYKFKLTRPKFYLLKPDRGFIEVGQSITVDITIHQDGVSEGESDKLKCFYRSVGHFKDEPTKDWEKDEIETYNIRLPIIINGLPEQLRRHDEAVKRSEVKSLSGSKFDANKQSNSSTLQSSIKQKQSKLATLRNQIQSLERGSRTSVKPKNQRWPLIVAGGVSLLIGLLSSIWI